MELCQDDKVLVDPKTLMTKSKRLQTWPFVHNKLVDVFENDSLEYNEGDDDDDEITRLYEEEASRDGEAQGMKAQRKIMMKKRLWAQTLAACIALKCSDIPGNSKDVCAVARCHNVEKW